MSTWLITGASRGLGKHLSREMARRGHTVIAAARDAGLLATLANESFAGDIVPLPLDLADAASIHPTIERALAAHGSIDGLVNNAAIGDYRPFLDHREDELLRLVQVNISAVMQLCHALLPHFLARGAGHIVNIGSDLARRPLANMAPYVASKHALLGFSHSLLREVKDRGVRVNLINPGIIDTDFGGASEGSRPAHASLQPREFARLIADVIDGQFGNLVVDELIVHPLGQDY